MKVYWSKANGSDGGSHLHIVFRGWYKRYTERALGFLPGGTSCWDLANKRGHWEQVWSQGSTSHDPKNRIYELCGKNDSSVAELPSKPCLRPQVAVTSINKITMAKETSNISLLQDRVANQGVECI